MEPYLDTAYIAASKQHMDNTNFEATWCRDTSLIVTGTSLKTILHHRNISFWRNNDDPVQTNIITKEVDIRIRFCVSFFAVAKKSILLLLWLVTRSAAPSRFDKYMVWEKVKMYENLSLYFLENVFHHNFTRLLLLLKWLWTFRLSITSISRIWDESSVRHFLIAAFIENSISYWSVSTTSTS